MARTTKPEVSGKVLRWVVCLTLQRVGRPLTIAEIVRAVEERYTIPGRAGKTISDALRWEVRRGRVQQRSRGLYAAGRVQRSTAYSMRKRVEAWELSLVAPTAAVSDAPMKSAAAAAAADRYGPGPLDLDAMSISDEPTTAAWSFNADAFGD